MDPFLIDRTHPPRRLLYRDAQRKIVLRPWSFDDIDPMLAALEASGKELREFMVWAHAPFSRATQFQVIQNFLSQYWSGREYVFAAFGEDGSLLGGLGLHPRTALNPRALEVGYWCHSAHAGKGIITQGVRMLIALAFDWFECDRLQVSHDETNPASRRVIEKCGFRYEGTLINTVARVAPELYSNGYLGSPRHLMYALTPDALGELDWLPEVRANLLVEDALGYEHCAPRAKPEAENKP